MTDHDLATSIAAFLAGSPHAVVGASTNRDKYGNKVLRCYMQNDREAFPINPHEPEIEGLRAYPTLESLPRPVHGISIITPPSVTEGIVRSALSLGIKHIWMQPGAVHEQSVRTARAQGCNVIAAEACILVVLGYHEH